MPDKSDLDDPRSPTRDNPDWVESAFSVGTKPDLSSLRQLLISADQVFSISLTTDSGIGM
ncbi:hypothetical protein SAMN05444158_4674 [Bradyrhizobium canariense]|uniref:Uncharacterized protein n=1 Tax=Bradyrhizobium canariense TaxID=255045 RepID=A0A1H1Y7T3_9BRAD|nr:hypothetical protein SAMN05444158_4674 [Bradyrhizobium canariense]